MALAENFSQAILYIIFWGAMLFLSITTNGLLLKFSFNLGAKNESQQVRWASTAKPAFGGVTFYILFLISVVFCSIFFSGEQFLNNWEFLGLFAASTIGFLMGLADDAFNTKPFLKFFIQFLCAGVYILTGSFIKVFPWEWLNILTTFLWVTGIMNSVNMLDNMDGITSGVSLIICASILLILLFLKQFSNIDMAIIIGVSAALLGFLYYNWNPSRMYMGDSGSQFLGAFLAGIAIKYLWNGSDYYGQIIQAKQILIPALIFIVPISDTITVSINRIMKGKSPFVGGRDHTTHHLSYLGLTDRHVAILMISISILTMILSIFIINNIKSWQVFHTVIFSGIFLIILISLYLTTVFGKSKSK